MKKCLFQFFYKMFFFSHGACLLSKESFQRVIDSKQLVNFLILIKNVFAVKKEKLIMILKIEYKKEYLYLQVLQETNNTYLGGKFFGLKVFVFCLEFCGNGNKTKKTLQGSGSQLSLAETHKKQNITQFVDPYIPIIAHVL